MEGSTADETVHSDEESSIRLEDVCVVRMQYWVYLEITSTYQDLYHATGRRRRRSGFVSHRIDFDKRFVEQGLLCLHGQLLLIAQSFSGPEVAANGRGGDRKNQSQKHATRLKEACR